LERPTFRGWMQQNGVLCVRHARKLSEILPASLQQVVEGALERTNAALEKELKEFFAQTTKGTHTGAGVLGRAAEFLVAQRGVLDYEGKEVRR